MKFPLSWIADYVDLTGIDPSDLASRLNRSGFEVEEVITVGESLCNIVTGRIDSISKHPNADRLQVTQIFDGEVTHQIVTGAQNISVGDIVPVSLPGAILASGLKIKPSQLRGIPSNGMLCSETELGVADTASGIWILEPGTPLGLDFVESGLLKETILDVAILPNRGDCQSILGLAREISVILNRPLKLPSTDYSITEAIEKWQIAVTDPEVCPIYFGQQVDHVTNGIAPLKMRRRLALAGIRSIDRIVDITNYVMLETGHPLHAFDKNELSGTTITVGSASAGEMTQTLDDEVRELTVRIPVVRDGLSIVAIAGIMGGQRGSIAEKTTELFLEAAYFSPTRVRKAKSELGLRTESAIRFEKGVDPMGVQFALRRALHLLQELAGARIVGAPVEHIDLTHSILSERDVEFNSEKINRLLGTAYTRAEMEHVLAQLGFGVAETSARVPSWRRHDIKEWPCLAEEIARIKGYDPIPEILDFRMVAQEKPSNLSKIATVTETFWVNQGFQQVQTFTMVSPDDFRATKVPMPSDWLQIQNPLTPSESVLRRYLMSSLLRTVSYNLKRQNTDLQLFEVGKVFYLAQQGEIREHLVCGVICTGNRFVSPYSEVEKVQGQPSFFHLKGQVEELLSQLRVAGVSYAKSSYPQYHPHLSADIRIGATTIGNFGFFHPDILENYDIRQPVGYIGLNLSGISGEPTIPMEFNSFGRYPHTRRDLAILAPRTLGYQEIESKIGEFLPEAVAQYFLFDHFESDKIGADNKSLAFGFVYQNIERTLSDDEVNLAHEEFCRKLTESLPISIR